MGAMHVMKLYYLGPEGSFTHQAAMLASKCLREFNVTESFNNSHELIAVSEARLIMQSVEQGCGWGVFAWENNIEGVVIPNLDMLLESHQALGVARVSVDVSFDAFIRDDETLGDVSESTELLNNSDGMVGNIDELLSNYRTVYAHPHGLAQCRRFSQRFGLTQCPATSNAAACRDLQPGQVALGPSICGQWYGLRRIACGVEDFPGARTEFLLIAPRGEAQAWLQAHRQAYSQAMYGSIIACIPRCTGPGVLANLLDVVRDAGLNMTSFMSRPIKGQDATYSFIATVDAAPWSDSCRHVLREAVKHGDWVRTLAVYPRSCRKDPPVDTWMLPQGGLCINDGVINETIIKQGERALLW